MTAQKKGIAVFLLLGLAVIAGSLYGFYEAEDAVPIAAGVKEEDAAPPATVYVCGAVRQPGLVRIAEGARAADAVKLCGGLLPTADAAGVNMAQLLKDGAQITVPEKILPAAAQDSSERKKAPAKEALSSEDQIHINTANEKELDRLPGIGPAMAAAIVAYRREAGPFQSVEDLMKVRGIGAAKFAKLKEKAAL